MGKLWIISGDDEFAVKAAAAACAAKLSDGAPENDQAFEIICGDGDELNFSMLMDRTLSALRTPPFLEDHQVVWLKNFLLFDELSAEYKNKNAAGEVAALLTSPLPPEQTVIISGTGLDMRKALSRALKNAGAELTLCAAAKLNDRNYAENRRAQIVELCREAGKRISPVALQFLENLLGSNAGIMRRELEKLFCYVGDAAEITPEDCRAICSKTPEAVSWSFTGALVERNAAEALQYLDLLLRQGDAALKVLAAVSMEFQRLVQVRLALSELGISRVNSRTFDSFGEAEKAKYPDNMLLKLHPFRAYKMCESAMRFSDAALASSIRAVMAANRALVSGGGDDRMVLEELVFAIAGSGGR